MIEALWTTETGINDRSFLNDRSSLAASNVSRSSLATSNLKSWDKGVIVGGVGIRRGRLVSWRASSSGAFSSSTSKPSKYDLVE
ncbi:hypothetical protein U1Q18_014451, partial [Sarracenia purpurea var. burkii]